MTQSGLEHKIVDRAVLNSAVERFRERGILLPTFEELADPTKISEQILASLERVDPDAPDPLNLFRIHWYNDGRGGLLRTPQYVELTKELTGVDAKIVVLLGKNFPMIHAHKVLPAYGCLAPRIVTGQFDPTFHNAIWPSTGNYCRGGVAVSRIMDSTGVAILPEGMSQERFDWLEKWVRDPESDIVRTYGCESNVKEIYDACNKLKKEPRNFIFNQFSEFANYLVHHKCTGAALLEVARDVQEKNPDMELKPGAFVSATGSAGTIGAGDRLKETYGAGFKIVAAEAMECPTLLCNGYGEHNIQGIGDKHIPYIHNVMNTDIVTAISDNNTNALFAVFNTAEGKNYLINQRHVQEEIIEALSFLGLSSICNILAAIKTAKYYGYRESDVIFTVATDGAELYSSEIAKGVDEHFDGAISLVNAAEAFGRYMLGVDVGHFLEMNRQEKLQRFNLGYFTWVEQQGISVEQFAERGSQEFWQRLSDIPPIWDSLIRDFNAETGVQPP